MSVNEKVAQIIGTYAIELAGREIEIETLKEKIKSLEADINMMLKDALCEHCLKPLTK